jgi:hypothetical protein
MSIANDPGGGSAPRALRAGLCDSCEHQQLVRNTRGSTFSLCRRSRDDPAFPRYPRLPVIECPGYQRGARPAGAGD